jgi:hypothetical protein
MVKRALLLTLLYLAAVPGMACDNGAPPIPTTTSAGTTVPQPFKLCEPTQPEPDKPIAGCWVGTFDTSDPGDCHTDTPATATFGQDGSVVTGTLSAFNACGIEGLAFEGTLNKDQLFGHMKRLTGTAAVVGILADDRLELTTSDLWVGREVTPSGKMHLHR